MESFPASSLCRRINDERITLNPSYQREAVWRKPQEELLIDSVLLEIDIPKIYVRELDDKNWEVVDGQQRLRTILKFRHDRFPINSDARDSNGKKAVWAGKKFSELSEEIKDRFETYQFHIVILQNASDEDVADMFLRMQNGTTLNAAERRNAMPGKVRDFVEKLAEHSFFKKSCKFSGKRYAYQHVAAQMLLLEMEGEPSYITNTELVNMYEMHKNSFSERSDGAKNVKKILNILHKAFPKKNHVLERHTMLFLYFFYFENFLEILPLRIALLKLVTGLSMFLKKNA